MQTSKSILRIVLCSLVACAVVVACGKDEDVLETQQKAILSYLTSRLKLVSEQEAAQAEGGTAIPFYAIRSGTYRYITNYYRSDRPTEEAATGDRLRIDFEAYTFSNAPGSYPYYTNIRETGAALAERYGLDTTYWDFTPRTVELRKGQILKGLLYALPQCRIGDTVQVYMPSTLAYGDKSLGAVEAGEAVMFNVIIHEIEK